jgi:hypothetical protein
MTRIILAALTASLLATAAQAQLFPNRPIVQPIGPMQGPAPQQPRSLDGPVLGGSPYNPNSTSNPYGRYGSPYSPDSPNNPYGRGLPLYGR